MNIEIPDIPDDISLEDLQQEIPKLIRAKQQLGFALRQIGRAIEKYEASLQNQQETYLDLQKLQQIADQLRY
jgi:DNA-binding transcriptional MerR regulator